MPIFGFICKKSHFSRKIVKITSLSSHCFAYRNNWDSKSKSETTFGLVSMSRIQWQSQNLETNFC